MTELNFAELTVELLPARTTLAGLNAIGGNGGNGGTAILSGIALGLLNSGNVTASASNGGSGGSAANVIGG